MMDMEAPRPACPEADAEQADAQPRPSTMGGRPVNAISGFGRRRDNPRMEERPGQSFAAIDAPPGACAIVNRAGEAVAVFTRYGWSLFDAKDAQLRDARNLAVMRCSDGAVLYRFEGDARRRGSWKLEVAA